MEMSKSSTIGSFVAKDYRAATVFQKYGIDFCCKGGRSIEDVCTKNNLSSDTLLNELANVTEIPNKMGVDFQSWSMDLLVDYIERKHHRYIRETTPAIKEFLNKLCEVHGTNHPELFEIRSEFNSSADELVNHMKYEEEMLFPMVRNLVSTTAGAVPQNFTLQDSVKNMMIEHDVEGERFRKISQLSDNYTTPDDGCTTYRVAYSLLNEFESDLHLHIHLENNILFTKILELERAVLS